MLLLLASLAHALTCREIQNMVNVNVPVSIVVETIRGGGGLELGTDTCLAKAGMPAEVVAAARAAERPPPPAEAAPARAAAQPQPRPPDLGVAREAARQGDWPEWDDRIAKGSPLWPEAQFEAAWADFMRHDLNAARARLQGVRDAKAWMPGLPFIEYLVIDGLYWVDWNRCLSRKQRPLLESGAREAAVTRLNAELEPARRELAAVVAGERSVESLPPALRGDSARMLREVEDALAGVRAQEATYRQQAFWGHGRPCIE